MRLFNPLFFLAFFEILTVTAKLFGDDSSKNINLWSKEDLQQFLYDRGLTYNKHSKTDELKKLAANEWNKLTASDSSWSNVKQKVLDGSSNTFTGSPTLAYDQSYKDWIFETWSKQDLYKFIHKNNIQFNKDQSYRVLSNDELINVIKENWDKVLKNNKKQYSGYYPGEWLYRYWNTASLKKWLKQHDIDYSITDSRQDLLDKVRKNIYTATLNDHLKSNYDTVKQNILTSSDNIQQYMTQAAADAQKKYKGFKPDESAFRDWTVDDLKQWLAYNKQSVDGSTKDLTDRAYGYLAVKKGKTDSTYEKISKAVQAKVNEADKKRVGFEHQISKFLFDTLSIADLKLWLKQHKKSTEGTVEDLYDRAVETYEGAAKNLHQNMKEAQKHKDHAQEVVEENKKKAEKHRDHVKDMVEDNNKKAAAQVEEYYSAANEYFKGWSADDLKAWLAEHKQSTEGNAEELYANAVKSFDSLYSNLVRSFDEKQKKTQKQAGHLGKNLQVGAAKWWNNFYLTTYDQTYNWYAKAKSLLTGEKALNSKSKNIYFITPKDNWFTRVYKNAAVNFRYYVLGQQIYV